MHSVTYNYQTGETTTEPYIPGPNDDEVTQLVPVSVSRFQARAAMLQDGILDQVEAAVAGAGPMAQLAWAEATEWRRDSPTINALADVIGLSQSELDELFIEAAKVRA